MADGDERLRQAVRVGNIGIFEHDHATDVIFYSQELRQLYGFDAEETVTLAKILSRAHPDEATWLLAAVRRAHDPSGDGAFDIESRIIDGSGRLKWLLTRSRTLFESRAGERCPARTIGAVQDITERRMAEERMRVLETVLSSSAQAVAIADASGTLTFTNPAVHRLWGYSDREILLGRSLFDLWKTDAAPATALAAIRDQRRQQVEMPATRIDGGRFYLRITAEAVCDPRGALTQVLVTFSDITDRKRLEDQLLQAQKMESVGRLAGGIAHDFNNLLTVISAGVELGAAALPADHPSQVHLADVADAAQSAAALTRHLLAFSRKEIIAPKVLDLNEVIRRTEKMLSRLVGEDIELVTSCAGDLPPIRFDPAQVAQILVNLAVNARDAMPGGGQLTVATSQVWLDQADAARHVDLTPGPYVLLELSDSGSGISDDARAHIFEPFFTTKGPGAGTGLGLAMVYGAVQQNGGRIEVQSELDHGTTFKIYLPAATGSPEPLSVTPGPAERGGGVAVVLVEDDQRVRGVAERALTSVGYQVHAFANGSDALAALASLRPVPQLLITDVIMPGMNGRVLAERATRALPDLRVLFVSGYTEGFIVDRGVLNAGIEFLPKPYSIEQLARRARQVLGDAVTR